MYSTDLREDGDRSDPTALFEDGDTCDHERTVYVDGGSGSTGSLTCRQCGNAVLAEDDRPADDPQSEIGLSARCRWVLDRVGGRY